MKNKILLIIAQSYTMIHMMYGIHLIIEESQKNEYSLFLLILGTLEFVFGMMTLKVFYDTKK